MNEQSYPNTSCEDGKSLADLECLLDKLGGDFSQLLRCLGIFKLDAARSLQAMSSGLAETDVKKAKNACHGLRGVLMTMEMRQAAGTAATLETLIIEKNFARAKDLLAVLYNEIERTVQCIEESMDHR